MSRLLDVKINQSSKTFAQGSWVWFSDLCPKLFATRIAASKDDVTFQSSITYSLMTAASSTDFGYDSDVPKTKLGSFPPSSTVLTHIKNSRGPML